MSSGAAASCGQISWSGGFRTAGYRREEAADFTAGAQPDQVAHGVFGDQALDPGAHRVPVAKDVPDETQGDAAAPVTGMHVVTAVLVPALHDPPQADQRVDIEEDHCLSFAEPDRHRRSVVAIDDPLVVGDELALPLGERLRVESIPVLIPVLHVQEDDGQAKPLPELAGTLDFPLPPHPQTMIVRIVPLVLLRCPRALACGRGPPEQCQIGYWSGTGWYPAVCGDDRATPTMSEPRWLGPRGRLTRLRSRVRSD